MANFKTCQTCGDWVSTSPAHLDYKTITGHDPGCEDKTFNEKEFTQRLNDYVKVRHTLGPQGAATFYVAYMTLASYIAQNYPGLMTRGKSPCLIAVEIIEGLSKQTSGWVDVGGKVNFTPRDQYQAFPSRPAKGWGQLPEWAQHRVDDYNALDTIFAGVRTTREGQTQVKTAAGNWYDIGSEKGQELMRQARVSYIPQKEEFDDPRGESGIKSEVVQTHKITPTGGTVDVSVGEDRVFTIGLGPADDKGRLGSIFITAVRKPVIPDPEKDFGDYPSTLWDRAKESWKRNWKEYKDAFKAWLEG